MATVGEAIDAKAKEYIDLYERFREDGEFRDRAASLATHDLVMQRYIASTALERVEAYISSRENEDEEGTGTICFGRGQEGGKVCIGRKEEGGDEATC